MSKSSDVPSDLLTLVDQSTMMMFSALAKSSLLSYQKTWLSFIEFIKKHKLQNQPTNAGHVMVYLMSLVNQGLAPSTVLSKMSAINFAFKLFKLPEPASDFWIKEFLCGLKKGNPQTDLRIPITLDVLQSMINLLSKLKYSMYDQLLYQAMFTLAFHAFLRPGEVTGEINNLDFCHCKVNKKDLKLTFFKFKHHKGPPYTIKVVETQSVDCPVRAMSKYLKVRGSGGGPLFCLETGDFVTYKKLNCLLKFLCKCLKINGKCTPHSFRIGAATWAADQGASDDEIKRIGRWSSDSFLKYIRLPTLALKLNKK